MKYRLFLNVFFLGLWLVAAGGSYFFLLQYKGVAGATGNTTDVWPRDGIIEPAADRPTLVMLAHPCCPCTAASLDELASLLARFPGRVAAHVLFLHYENHGYWEQQDLWQRAQRIPEVVVSADEDGREAKKFGAATSGHVLVYHQDGRLLFDGGITAARGHAGASVGSDRLRDILAGAAAAPSSLPVFGCPLENPL
jgi:hypothetical protein